ncbi:MAG: hypothetical protein QW474_00245 [Candidatus Aenigmatarchaeota archaeon]
MNIKLLKKYLKIKKTTLLLVIILSVFLFIVPYALRYSGYKGMEGYLYHISVAKALFVRSNYPATNTVYGPVYPYSLYMLFILLGKTNLILAEWMDLLFLSLTPVIIFLITKLTYKSNKTAIFSSIIFILITHFTIFLNFEREFVDFSNFFIALTILLFLLSYKINNKKFYTLSLITLLITGLIKYEFMILSYLFIIGLFLYLHNKLKSSKQIKILLIPLIIFFILSIYYLYNLNLIYPNPFERPLDIYSAINWVEHPFMRPSYLFECSIKRVRNLLSMSPLLIFILLFFIGVIHGLKKYKNNVLFFLFSFMLLNLPYSMCQTCYFTRYYLYTIVPFVVLSSASFDWIIRRINRWCRTLILVSLVLLLSSEYLNLLYNFDKPKPSLFFEKDYSMLNFLTSMEFNKTIIIVPPAGREKDIFLYWTMKETMPIDDIVEDSMLYSKIRESKMKEKNISSPSLLYKEAQYNEEILNQTIKEIKNSIEKNNKFKWLPEREFVYFIKTDTCRVNSITNELCNLIIKNYKLIEVYADEEINVYRVIFDL